MCCPLASHFTINIIHQLAEFPLHINSPPSKAPSISTITFCVIILISSSRHSLYSFIATPPSIIIFTMSARQSRQSSPSDAADGLYVELNLSDGLMRKTAMKCPAIRNGGKKGVNRGIRQIITNDTTRYTSRPLLQNIHKEVAEQLKQHGITVKTYMSNAEWVLAPTNGRSAKNGPTHRDTNQTQPGYLTVLLFFGDRKLRGYGGVKIWKNSQSFHPGHDSIGGVEFNNVLRDLKKLDGGWGTIVNLKEFNCVVFDSRLIHESLPHTQHTPRASLTFFLTLKGMVPLPQACDDHYAKPEECDTIDMQQYL